MCNQADIDFGRRILTADLVAGRDVLEVGSYDGNGSLRPHVEALGPAHYMGLDMKPGPGVDIVARAEALPFPDASFDVVISTELLEHVRDWQRVVTEMKRVLRIGGLLVLTTRSFGYPYHGEPIDCWRYEASDMGLIPADCDLIANEVDRSMPGVLVAATRVARQSPDLGTIRLYAVPLGRQAASMSRLQLGLFRVRSPRRAASLFPVG